MADHTDCSDIWCPDHSPLMNARMRFWVCPVTEHADRFRGVTVEWRDDVAYCTSPGCGEHS